jgi:hypothetical protein
MEHPAGQQPSPLAHVVMGVCPHCRWQAAPVSTSVVQATMSLQAAALAGQLPSHASMPSTTPLPQLGEQSASLVALHPGAQQPSPPVHVVMGV